jgi:Ca2+-binding EF-hand superfamily protein
MKAGGDDGMMLIEPKNMIQSIFLDCDKDNDGALSASEYSAFLRTIGSWGKHKYTDDTWADQWCVHLVL